MAFPNPDRRGPRFYRAGGALATRRRPPVFNAGLVALLAAGIAASGGCSPPAACREAGSVPRSAGYDTKRDGESLTAWQARARTAMVQALDLEAAGGQHVPVAVREPASRPAVGTAVLLHGHGDTALSIIDVADLGAHLSRRGWRVIAPALRGFGQFPRGSDRHRPYVATLADDVYLPMVLADLQKTVAVETARTPGPTVIMGHSLGAHLALHLAALEPAIDAVILLGHFIRSACVNSPEHHRCQHHRALARTVGTEDLALLVAPRRLEVVWGAEDRFYTDAARGLIEMTARRFAAHGAGAQFSSVILPGRGHVVDGDTVTAFFESLRPKPSLAP